MKYKWTSFGERGDNAIALIASSNGFANHTGQEKISNIINALKSRGFNVKVPIYEDGYLVVPSICPGRSSSSVANSVTPAVDPLTGTDQIIKCIKFGWNIMPLMGGDSFEAKIPYIINYFRKNPQDKNEAVKIFGYSNSTYASILASHGICTFISTPFSFTFFKEEFVEQASQLELVMKNQECLEYERRILCNPNDALNQLGLCYHFPVNFGNIFKEVETKNYSPGLLKLNIEHNLTWSIGFEGFLQKRDSFIPINYKYGLKEFLEIHKQKGNLPKFIELGNIATRFDGANGYGLLNYDQDDALILIDELNIKKLLNQKDILKEHIKKITLLLENPESKLSSFHKEILGFMPEAILAKAKTEESFTEAEIQAILSAQNQAIMKIREDIMSVAREFNIPVIINSRNGHCANMSVVNGGWNICKIWDGKFTMKLLSSPEEFQQQTSFAAKISGDSDIKSREIDKS